GALAAIGGAEADRHVILTRLQQRLVMTGGRLVKHARYYWLMLAEGHLTCRLFGRRCDASRQCRSRRADRRQRIEAVRSKRGSSPGGERLTENLISAGRGSG